MRSVRGIRSNQPEAAIHDKDKGYRAVCGRSGFFALP
jgi:hypothetical protein